jgi:hypothetical protein
MPFTEVLLIAVTAWALLMITTRLINEARASRPVRISASSRSPLHGDRNHCR